MKVSGIIACMAILCFSSCGQSKQNRLEKEAAQQNKLCPRMIAEDLRMDSVFYRNKTNEFSFYYSLIGQDEHPDSIANLKKYLEVALPQQLKNAVEAKPYKEAGVTYTYTYCSDESKRQLIRIEIPAENY